VAEQADTRWVLLPVGQQASGAWIDGVLHDRLRESPVPGLDFVDDTRVRARVEVFRGADAEAQAAAAFDRRGWTDGLPIVVPTVYRVQETLLQATLNANEALGEIDPLRGIATVEKVAVNAVMAGCRPEYFPVVLAIVRALLDPAFNLRGVQTTDENVAPLAIVSGPVAERIGLNGGIGALGPGWRANATIGRAVRLVMSNIGGGWPGVVSLAGIGQPGRYSLCLGEREIAPWPTLAAESAASPEASIVTVLRAESVVNVTGGIDELASAMSSATSAFSMLNGGHVAVIVAPHTARRLVDAGWSKADVARYLHDRGRMPVETWRRMWIRNEIGASRGLPGWVTSADAAGAPIPVVESPENIIVFVAGGDAPIAQQVYFPTWGFPACRVVVPVEDGDGK